MKELKDYKEEIHRCSKCGLCQSACPVYRETGNDCTVSRGQFILLNGVIKGDLKLNKNINKYLDICLKCNKCKSACPTNIDVVKIILSAKNEYFKNSLEGKIYSIPESKLVFNTALNLIGIVSNLFKPKAKPIKLDSPKSKVVYFGGCVEKFNPSIRDYVKEILADLNIELLDTNLGCCGMPFLTTGNFDRFKEQLEENLNNLKNLEFDYIVTDCASCEFVWREYAPNIKLKNLYELIAESNLEFSAKEKQVVTYHKPCHETSTDYIEKIISRCKNIEYKELNGYDECCGFAGLEHPKSLSVVSSIIKKKGENIKSTKADFLLTTCVGCVISTALSTLFKVKTKRLITFLKDECFKN